MVPSGWGREPCLPPTVSGRYLSFAEREDIAILRAQGLGVREIARRYRTVIPRRSRGSCVATCRRGHIRPTIRASIAQWHAERRARRPKVAKLCGNDKLRDYVQERLSGPVKTPTVVPSVHRATVEGKEQAASGGSPLGTRRGVPEQIAKRLPVDFPDDETMRISHEAIYQALYVQGRGALKRELVACLRTGRALRVPQARSRQKAWAHVTPEVLISERPAEAEDRAVPGHWEGDLLIGLERSAIGTLVERTTRFTMLVHLPREEGYRHKRSRQERAGARRLRRGHHEERAVASAMSTLPEQLRTITDMGPRQGTLPTRGVQGRDGHSGLLRRPTQSLAARHQREHQRAASPILPKGHRPLALERTKTSKASPPRSTAGPARHSDGRHQRKHSTSTMLSNKPVLPRSIESGRSTWSQPKMIQRVRTRHT